MVFDEKNQRTQAEAYVVYLKKVLSDLYNALSDEKYNDRYTDLKTEVLSAYQAVDAGWNPAPQVNKILGVINHEFMRSVRLHVLNPPELKIAETKLRDANGGASDHRWIRDYAFLFGIMGQIGPNN